MKATSAAYWAKGRFSCLLAVVAGFSWMAMGAAGFSDMAQIQTVWLREPYALVWYPATQSALPQPPLLTLCRARHGNSLAELTLEHGVMPEKSLLTDIETFAFVDPNILLAKTAEGYYICDLKDVEHTLHKVAVGSAEEQSIQLKMRDRKNSFVTFEQYVSNLWARTFYIYGGSMLLLSVLAVVGVNVYRKKRG